MDLRLCHAANPQVHRKRSQGEVGNEGEEISRARRDQVDVH
jgi:hypothetical protein